MLSMEVPADEFVGSTNDQAVMIRGKRTKRHRTAAGVTCSSSSGGDHGSTSGGEVYESTEEEEDMANCLILLAQGGVTSAPQHLTLPEKSSARKFTEITADSAVDGGFYVYECKTCNRTFSSFQALGGHRASHKRPKTAPPPKEAVAVAEEKSSEIAGNHIPFAIPIARYGAVAVDHEQSDDAKLARNFQSPPLSLQFGNHITTTANNQKSFLKPNKTHECSICGSEFTSGQALGGHMRRHRAVAAASATTINSSTAEEKKARNILQLDLNLPAPEDDLRESKFQFSSAKQSIVFSSPALVDCHY